MNLIDESEIRKFLGLLHSRAAAALNHMRRPGVLQLVSISPDDRGMTVSPFNIGDVDSMVETALVDAKGQRSPFAGKFRLIFGQIGAATVEFTNSINDR